MYRKAEKEVEKRCKAQQSESEKGVFASGAADGWCPAQRKEAHGTDPSLYQKSRTQHGPSVAASQPTFSTWELHSRMLQYYEIDRESLCRLDDLVRRSEAVERAVYTTDGHQCT